MPFVSRSQMRLCFALAERARKRSREPSWDCDLWLSETPNPGGLPERVAKKKTL